MLNDAVRRVVRDKILDGRLPRERIGAVSATHGTDRLCAACSLSISPDEVVYKLLRVDSEGFVFHATSGDMSRTP
jgi:hypothetical protein